MYDWHKNRAKMVSFAGFEMPILYSSIKEEHLAVRTGAGIFDISHMGRLLAQGKEVLPFFNCIVPRNLEKLAVGRGAYSFVLNEHAGFRDDVVLFRLSETRFMLVWNAGNLEKIPTWISNILALTKQICGSIDVHLENIASESAMFAVQGPNALGIVEALFDGEVPNRWGVSEGHLASQKVVLSRTGYTGEDGFEISVLDTSYENPEKAQKVWATILGNEEVIPCGLGARDTLRQESGFSLYGNDIHEEVDPVTADLCFPPFVHLNKESFFIGKDTLLTLSQKPLDKIRIGFVSTSKGPSPRAGMALVNNGGEVIGSITSGSFSPLLEVGIGMGYVKRAYAEPGTKIAFEHRERKHPLEIRKFPLYDPNKFGHTRK